MHVCLSAIVLLCAMLFAHVPAIAMPAIAVPAIAVPPIAMPGQDTVSVAQSTTNAASEPSFFARTVLYIQAEQQRLHRLLAGAIRDLRTEGSANAAWVLISLSFMYGLFHAAGPGHGKAVLSAYLLTQPTALKRSLALAAASSFMQGVTAIVVVSGIIAVFGLAMRSSGIFVQWLEAASFTLVALVGAWLVWRSVQALAPRFGYSLGGHTHDHGRGHGHDHDHEHDHSCEKDHTHDASCGHAHVPTPQQAINAGSLREMAGVVFSIGLRPCSGAVLVLVFAQAVGMTFAGIAAVLAMSAGTAFAVALIALAAVGARDTAWALTRLDDARVALTAHGIAIIGGLILMVMGGMLAYASATQPAGAILVI